MNLLPAYGQVPEVTLIAIGVFRLFETRSGDLCHKPMGSQAGMVPLDLVHSVRKRGQC